jgi:hypothetical protein
MNIPKKRKRNLPVVRQVFRYKITEHITLKKAVRSGNFSHQLLSR